MFYKFATTVMAVLFCVSCKTMTTPDSGSETKSTGVESGYPDSDCNIVLTRFDYVSPQSGNKLIGLAASVTGRATIAVKNAAGARDVYLKAWVNIDDRPDPYAPVRDIKAKKVRGTSKDEYTYYTADIEVSKSTDGFPTLGINVVPYYKAGGKTIFDKNFVDTDTILFSGYVSKTERNLYSDVYNANCREAFQIKR